MIHPDFPRPASGAVFTLPEVSGVEVKRPHGLSRAMVAASQTLVCVNRAFSKTSTKGTFNYESHLWIVFEHVFQSNVKITFSEKDEEKADNFKHPFAQNCTNFYFSNKLSTL